MIMLRTLCFAFACCITLAACNEQQPTFDARDIPAYQKSLAAIKAKLSARDQQKLQLALLTLAFGNAAYFTVLDWADPAKANAYEAFDDVPNEWVLFNRMRPDVNGKTAAEVIRRVADIIDHTITEAEAEDGGATQDLARIVIENPRYRLPDVPSRALTAEFSVYNGSHIAISRIYLIGTLTAPGVKVPLVIDTFSRSFTPPLEAGVQQQVTMPLSMSGGWTAEHLQGAYDADLKLKVTNVSDSRGKALLAINVQALDALRRKRDMLRGG
jgi:hypothetical protein